MSLIQRNIGFPHVAHGGGHGAGTLGTVDSGFQDGDPPETASDLDESELRRELLNDKWRMLFDKFTVTGVKFASLCRLAKNKVDELAHITEGCKFLLLDANGKTTFFTLKLRYRIKGEYDPEGFGEIPWDEFLQVLKNPDFIAEVDANKREILSERAHERKTSAITFQEFVNVMTGKRSRSFKCAVHHRDREVCSENDFHILVQEPPLFRRMVRLIATEFLTEERDRKYYADHYTCCPPPLFILFITLIELGFFTYYTVAMGEINPSGPVPIDSVFIYRPDKRLELWRFIFYMVLHAGWLHLLFNLLVQVLVGLPLEMVHGSLRIGAVYMAGVLAGSLGTSVFDTDVYLVGASGGVYALLAAHLANILLNYSNMEFGIVRLIGIFVVASADVGFAIYDRYAAEPVGPSVSYVAHLTGALAGLTIGLLVLKNFEQKLHEQLMWWVALGVYAACTIFAILFNVFNPGPPPFP